MPAPGASETPVEYTDEFWRTIRGLRDKTVVDGLARLTEHWASLGGKLQYSVDPQLALYPVLRDVVHQPWLFGIYPGGSGTIEVPFQYMKLRPPFDDTGLRDQLRTKLNDVEGIDIPPARLGLRPRFSLDLLGSSDVVERLAAVMTCFVETAREAAKAEGSNA